MILMPQIFDVIANENAHYKRNELEYEIIRISWWKNEGIPFMKTKISWGNSSSYLFVVHSPLNWLDCVLIDILWVLKSSERMKVTIREFMEQNT